MISSSRELENALGDGVKKIEKNEIETLLYKGDQCILNIIFKKVVLLPRKT